MSKDRKKLLRRLEIAEASVAMYRAAMDRTETAMPVLAAMLKHARLKKGEEIARDLIKDLSIIGAPHAGRKWLEEQKRQLDEIHSQAAAYRAMLEKHKAWHLSRTEPEDMGGVEVIPAEAYSESGLSEDTEKALDGTAGRAILEALQKIANRSDDEMKSAKTLHYDMRGWAKQVLEGMKP